MSSQKFSSAKTGFSYMCGMEQNPVVRRKVIQHLLSWSRDVLPPPYTWCRLPGWVWRHLNGALTSSSLMINANTMMWTVFRFHEYESVLRLTPELSEILLALPAWMQCIIACHFWNIALRHGAVFLTDSAKLILVCWTVVKTWNKWNTGMKLIIENSDNLSIAHCTYIK